jgi:hypothetical protein
LCYYFETDAGRFLSIGSGPAAPGPVAGDFAEGLFHADTHNEDDFIDTRDGIEFCSCVRDDGLARDFQKQLVDVRPHAGAASGGGDDGAGHDAKV